MWRPGCSYNQFLEPTTFGTNVVGRIRFDLERPDWAQLRVLQLWMSDDTTAIAEVEESLPTELGCPPFLKALRRPNPVTTIFQAWVPISSTVIVARRRL